MKKRTEEDPDDFKEPSTAQVIGLFACLFILACVIGYLWENYDYEEISERREEKEDQKSSSSEEPDNEQGNGGIPAGAGWGIGIAIIVAYWYWSEKSEGGR